MMPKTVMPSQVSWQLVVTKSDGSVHGRGVVDAAGGALVGATSAALVSDPPTIARRTAAQSPSFAIGKLPSDRPHGAWPTLACWPIVLQAGFDGLCAVYSENFFQ